MVLNLEQLVIAPTIATFGEVNQGYPKPVYSANAGPSFEVDGVFDKAYREHVITDGEAVTVTMPVLGIKLIDFPEGFPKQGDFLVIRGKTYTVREVRRDGHGHAKIMLNEQTNYEGLAG